MAFVGQTAPFDPFIYHYSNFPYIKPCAPHTAEKGFPSGHRLSVHSWCFDILRKITRHIVGVYLRILQSTDTRSQRSA